MVKNKGSYTIEDIKSFYDYKVKYDVFGRLILGNYISEKGRKGLLEHIENIRKDLPLEIRKVFGMSDIELERLEKKVKE